MRRLEEIDIMLEELEKIGEESRNLEADKNVRHDDEDVDENEEEEYSGPMEKEMKKYQEKFREYVKSIRKNIRILYEPEEDAPMEKQYSEKGDERNDIKSPWERGHKLGCGCPGCTRYREVHGIVLENNHAGIKLHGLELSKRERPKNEYKENNARPCGGKHYHFFHGKGADFKRLFRGYFKKLNLNLAGY